MINYVKLVSNVSVTFRFSVADSLQLDQLKPSRPLALPLPPSTPARLFGSFPPADEIPSPAWEVEGEENSDRLSDEFNHKRRKTSPSPTIQVEPPTQLTEPVALDLAIVRNEPTNPDQEAGKREVEVELAENEEEEAVVESGGKEPSGKFADAASHSDLLSEDDPQSEKKGDSEIPQGMLVKNSVMKRSQISGILRKFLRIRWRGC